MLGWPMGVSMGAYVNYVDGHGSPSPTAGSTIPRHRFLNCLQVERESAKHKPASNHAAPIHFPLFLTVAVMLQPCQVPAPVATPR